MDLSGLTVAIVGRLARLPLGRANRELARRGAKLGGTGDCDIAVVGQGAAPRLRSGSLQSTLNDLKAEGVILLSERALLRVLDVLPAPEEIHREFDCFELARLSRLAMEEVEVLTLFDVLDPVAGFFGFADLRLARSCRAALDDGAELADVAGVAGILDVRAGLEDVRRDSVGELVLSRGTIEIERDGQIRLPLPACNPTLAELRGIAWAAEDQGDWELAARLYRKVLAAQPGDSISRFNLGNVLRNAGRRDAAILEFERAVGDDPGMADAWYNLALILEESGDQAGTRRALNGAVTADPTYVDALLLLLLFHFGEEEYEACVGVCERVILLRVDDGREETAKRALAACRIALEQSKRLSS